ncbi:ComEC/Rec2 family competence protein [Acidaminococcus intestini]|nr:ComEC/Rec2 family competence protein [Acidaminococcus intestini]
MGTYTAEGCLEPIETFYNPGMVDETKRSAARKIPGRIRTQNGCLHYEGGEKDALDRIAEWGSTVRKRLSEALPPREAALLGGMLLGGSEGMDASSLQIFTACGLSHLLSVSGSHVALLLGLYVLAAEYLPLPRPVKPLGASFSVLLRHPLRASGICLPSSAPWQRRLAGELLGRRASGPSFLGFSALLLLGIHPFWIWDIGFALSFAAAAGLMLLKERVERGLASFLGQGLGTALSVPLAAHIFSLPLLVHHFHAVSLLSLPANLLLVPLLSLSLVLAVSAVFGVLSCPFWDGSFLLWQAVSSVYLLNWAVCFQKAGPSWLQRGPWALGRFLLWSFAQPAPWRFSTGIPSCSVPEKGGSCVRFLPCCPVFLSSLSKSTFYSVFP